MTVWKFTLAMEEKQGVSMPQGAKILHLAEQHGELCLWALVDPDAAQEVREFVIAGTGHTSPTDGHVGTALMKGGEYVWHLFEVTQMEPPS